MEKTRFNRFMNSDLDFIRKQKLCLYMWCFVRVLGGGKAGFRSYMGL